MNDEHRRARVPYSAAGSSPGALLTFDVRVHLCDSWVSELAAKYLDGILLCYNHRLRSAHVTRRYKVDISNRSCCRSYIIPANQLLAEIASLFAQRVSRPTLLQIYFDVHFKYVSSLTLFSSSSHQRRDKGVQRCIFAMAF